jgi:hypothetical protein
MTGILAIRKMSSLTWFDIPGVDVGTIVRSRLGENQGLSCAMSMKYISPRCGTYKAEGCAILQAFICHSHNSWACDGGNLATMNKWFRQRGGLLVFGQVAVIS